MTYEPDIFEELDENEREFDSSLSFKLKR